MIRNTIFLLILICSTFSALLNRPILEKLGQLEYYEDYKKRTRTIKNNPQNINGWKKGHVVKYSFKGGPCKIDFECYMISKRCKKNKCQ